jgi:hypothetical protein
MPGMLSELKKNGEVISFYDEAQLFLSILSPTKTTATSNERVILNEIAYARLPKLLKIRLLICQIREFQSSL